MKRIAYLISPLLVLFLTSCEQNPRYSDLDGFWQVRSVEDKASGITGDAKGRLYISFECDLVKLTFYPEVRNKGSLGHEYISSYTVQDGILSFGTFYKYSYNIAKTEKELAPIQEVSAFGIYHQPDAFHLSISKKTMILENDEVRVCLLHY